MLQRHYKIPNKKFFPWKFFCVKGEEWKNWPAFLVLYTNPNQGLNMPKPWEEKKLKLRAIAAAKKLPD